MRSSLIFVACLLASGCRPTDHTEVYVCDSPNARRYHLHEDCRGLSNCDFRILKISLEEAKARGLTPCHWEK